MSETLTYYAFPDIHWQKIHTNNPLERIMRETREDNCLAICPTLASSRVEQRKQLALNLARKPASTRLGEAAERTNFDPLITVTRLLPWTKRM